MSFRLVNPFAQVVRVGWPDEEEPSDPRNMLFLIRVYMRPYSGTFIWPVSEIEAGLSMYDSPVPGAIAYDADASLVRYIYTSEANPPPYVKRPGALVTSDDPSYVHMQGYYMRGDFAPSLGLGGFGQFVTGDVSHPALGLWLYQPSSQAGKPAEYALAWDCYWGDNLDFSQITPHLNDAGTTIAYWTYDGPFENNHSGFSPFSLALHDHATEILNDTQWKVRHVWSFDEVTGAMSGPDWET